MLEFNFTMEQIEEIDPKSFEKKGFRLGIRHVQVTVMCLSNLLLFMMRSCLGVTILLMTDQSKINNTNYEIYNWSEEIRGVILSSFFWGYVVMQIPAGVLANKFGAKSLVMVALLLNGTFCILTPLIAKMGGWIAVCIIRSAMGLTQACLFPCTHTFLGKWAPPQERSTLSAIATIGTQFGVIITMPLCGVLASTYLGWHLIFYTVGCLGYIVAIIFWRFSASSPEQHPLIQKAELEYIQNSLNTTLSKTSLPIPWKKILTSVPLYAIAVTHAAALGWTYTLFFVQLPTYLKQGLGIDLNNSAILSALPFLSISIGHIAASCLADYIFKRNIMTTTNSRRMFNTSASFGTALCLIALGFLDSDHKKLGLALTMGAMGFLGTAGCGFVLNHLDLSPNFAGVTFSISNFVTSIFSILVPIFTGIVLGDEPSNPMRWRIIFCVAAAILTVSNIIYVIFIRTDLQPWNDPEIDAEYQLGNLKKKSLTSDQEINNYTFTEHTPDKIRP